MVLNQISGDATSIREARGMIREIMAERRPELSDVAELLTDEIATNAVLHGGGCFTVNFAMSETALRVTVSDRTPGWPIVMKFDSGAERGRGMAIVARLASNWGVERVRDGKVVWFELDLDR